MRTLSILTLAVVVATSAFARDRGKPPVELSPGPPDPATLRQGGDTFADAFLIPTDVYDTTGTTTGYTHDYDEACPYSGSESPDVVYRFTPGFHTVVDIDLFGSDYDTKVYVYGAGLELVACNDDYYQDYTSRIEDVEFFPGVKYYIVVDGYGGDHGTYHFFMGPGPPVGDVECDEGWPPENEPPLHDGYVDAFNGGCTNADQGVNLLDFPGDAPVCATSGWFDGGRDHDWYRAYGLAIYNSVQVMAATEYNLWLMAYAGADCGGLELRESLLLEPGVETQMWVGADPGEEIWFDVYPDLDVAPPGFVGHEFDYWIVQEYPIGEQPIAIEARNWSSVKGLFR